MLSLLIPDLLLLLLLFWTFVALFDGLQCRKTGKQETEIDGGRRAVNGHMDACSSTVEPEHLNIF